MFMDQHFNTFKMAIFPIHTYRLNAIHIQILDDFFVETDKLVLKFTWKHKGHRIAILKEKNV